MDRIICLDGPSASGKGSIARIVAQKLKWHLLLSGTIYRRLAALARQQNIAIDDQQQLCILANKITQQGYSYKITDMQLESEQLGEAASKLSTYPEVRTRLIPFQRSYYRSPGLVAEGRDMGTVIFPAAKLKIYLSASLAERAKRRMIQLTADKPGDEVKIDTIIHQLQERDRRDEQRAVAPLQQAEDAITIDSTTKSIAQVVTEVIELAKQKFNLTIDHYVS